MGRMATSTAEWVARRVDIMRATYQVATVDNVTHALAGLLLADATTAWVAARSVRLQPEAEPTGLRSTRTAFQKTAVLLGIIAAELPDADLLYSGPVLGMGKLGYLLHHRGHTHTLLFALASAVVLWGIALALHKWRQRRRDEAPWCSMQRWALLWLAVLGTLSHILLDFTNNYGVHPFWPLNSRWFYGDAVFIVEPWLWVAAIPPLLWGARSRWGRGLLGGLLLLMLAASWLLGQLSPPVALAVTIGAVLWTVTHWWIARQHTQPRMLPVLLGAAAWIVVESTFFTATARAYAVVDAAVAPGTLADIVLTPGVSNPLCFSAIVVTYDDVLYRVTTAVVAPWSSIRSARSCAGDRDDAAFGTLRGVSPSPLTASSAMVWRQTWSASRREMVALAGTNCEFSAALRFMRVPVWQAAPNGRISVADLRYGVNGGGFAALDLAPQTARCALPEHAWVPGWEPPRQDVLDGVLR